MTYEIRRSGELREAYTHLQHDNALLLEQLCAANETIAAQRDRIAELERLLAEGQRDDGAKRSSGNTNDKGGATMAIDFSKPVQTREGKKVRIYATDVQSRYPVHGAVWDEGLGDWYPRTWTREGKIAVHIESHEEDLVNVPGEKTLWLNIYGNKAYAFDTLGAAKTGECPGLVARVKVTYKEGQRDE